MGHTSNDFDSCRKNRCGKNKFQPTTQNTPCVGQFACPAPGYPEKSTAWKQKPEPEYTSKQMPVRGWQQPKYQDGSNSYTSDFAGALKFRVCSLNCRIVHLTSSSMQVKKKN